MSALPLPSRVPVRGQPQTAPSCHPSCQPEGHCCRPAWQEERFSATYHGAWTGVAQRPVDETEGFEVEEEKNREEVEKFRVYWGLAGSNLPSAIRGVGLEKVFSTHDESDQCLFMLVLLTLPALWIRGLRSRAGSEMSCGDGCGQQWVSGDLPIKTPTGRCDFKSMIELVPEAKAESGDEEKKTLADFRWFTEWEGTRQRGERVRKKPSQKGSSLQSVAE